MKIFNDLLNYILLVLIIVFVWQVYSLRKEAENLRCVYLKEIEIGTKYYSDYYQEYCK